MSDPTALIGTKEGPELEFKGVGVLDNLYRLSRAVVGMLNSRGGKYQGAGRGR